MTAAATLPWWGVIAGSAVVLRACLTLPIFVFQQRAASRAQSLGKVTATWQHSMRSSLKLELASKHLSDEEFEKILKKKLKRKHHDLMLKQGCHPIMNFLLPLSQLPIWLSMTYILRHLCGIPLPFFDQADSVVPAAPGMTTEGTLWFADLSSADPTYMLSVITGCLYMANVLLARRMAKMYPPPGVPGASGSTEQSLLSKSVGGVIISTPFLMAYIALNQPASIVFYWAVSAAFSLLQNLVFQNHWLRKTLKFPHAKKA
ncbi:hypothetical protein GQ54DRAFT_292405 [Martensiomyces pterosporus]|nr:hypothetical protein GQ54DRAFT_292405 [Martensiomyces pterosporus]